MDSLLDERQLNQCRRIHIWILSSSRSIILTITHYICPTLLVSLVPISVLSVTFCYFFLLVSVVISITFSNLLITFPFSDMSRLGINRSVVLCFVEVFETVKFNSNLSQLYFAVKNCLQWTHIGRGLAVRAEITKMEEQVGRWKPAPKESYFLALQPSTALGTRQASFVLETVMSIHTYALKDSWFRKNPFAESR